MLSSGVKRSEGHIPKAVFDCHGAQVGAHASLSLAKPASTSLWSVAGSEALTVQRKPTFFTAAE